MPELPEVEVLRRHLEPLLTGRRIRGVLVRRAKSIHPCPPDRFAKLLEGAVFRGVGRRGKYLVFQLEGPGRRRSGFQLLAHLGMTGRLYLVKKGATTPKHAALRLDLGRHWLLFEDTRYFGRMTLDAGRLSKLGPEPLGAEINADYLRNALHGCRQAIKPKLLDQSLVAGIGNIYASEILFSAGLSPAKCAGRLSKTETIALLRAMRQVLRRAIRFGSTVPLNFSGGGSPDGLFYYGLAENAPDYYQEELRVYDRAGQPCHRCGALIRRVAQSGRSTYFCPVCQR